MALSNPNKFDSKLADSNDNPQIADSQSVVVELTDSSGGTADDTVAAVSGSGADSDINNNFADLTAKVNAVLQILAAHGLMDDA